MRIKSKILMANWWLKKYHFLLYAILTISWIIYKLACQFNELGLRAHLLSNTINKCQAISILCHWAAEVSITYQWVSGQFNIRIYLRQKQTGKCASLNQRLLVLDQVLLPAEKFIFVLFYPDKVLAEISCSCRVVGIREEVEFVAAGPADRAWLCGEWKVSRKNELYLASFHIKRMMANV